MFIEQARVMGTTGRLLILIIGLLIGGCGEGAEPPAENALATVGERTITAATFRRAYILRILYQTGDDTDEQRSGTLQELIDQKIFAQLAEANHFDTLQVVRFAAKKAQRQAMAALLYEEWVQQHVPAPTDDDLWQAFVRGQTRLLVRHLAVKSESAADSVRALLIAGTENFEQLASRIFKEPQLRDSGGMMGWVSYGDLDQNLEDAIYALRPGEISKPVNSLYGWHIMRVDDVRRAGAIDRREFAMQRINLETKVYRRREQRLGTQILNDYMDEQEIRFDREVAAKLWAILKDQSNSERHNGTRGPNDAITIPNHLYGITASDFLQTELVNFVGGSWTVGMFLERFPEMKKIYREGNLYTGTAYLIRDELLAREGLARNFDRDLFVLRKVADRRDQVLADLYIASMVDTTVLPSAEPRDLVSILKRRALERETAHYKVWIDTLALYSLNLDKVPKGGVE